MTSDECIAELNIAIAERQAFLSNGTPTRHSMADQTLGKFIGFVSYGSNGTSPPEMGVVFRYAESDISVDRRAGSYEYTRRPKGELDPSRKTSGEVRKSAD